MIDPSVFALHASPRNSVGPVNRVCFPSTHRAAIRGPLLSCQPTTTRPFPDTPLARVDRPGGRAPRSIMPVESSHLKARAKPHPFHASPTMTLPLSLVSSAELKSASQGAAFGATDPSSRH